MRVKTAINVWLKINHMIYTIKEINRLTALDTRNSDVDGDDTSNTARSHDTIQHWTTTTTTTALDAIHISVFNKYEVCTVPQSALVKRWTLAYM